MEKRHEYISFVMILCLGALPTGLWAYGGGSGTPEDPYLIYTAEEMNSIGLNLADWDKDFRLMADLDLSAYTGNQFNLIGLYRAAQDPNEDLEVPFSGVFDGQGYTIANFTYEVTGDEDPADGWVRGIGLFRLIDGANAEIRDLTLVDPNLYPSSTCMQRVGLIGALAGVVKSGLVTGCHVEGGHIRAEGIAGGLAGSARRHYIDDVPGPFPTFSHCSADCDVALAPERPYVDAELANVFLHSCVGGLLGHNWGMVSDCCATGPVSGHETAGGLAGYNRGDIVRCHATGPVFGGYDVGGLVGESYRGSISSSWAGGDVIGTNEWAPEEPLVRSSRGTTSSSWAGGDVIGIDEEAPEDPRFHILGLGGLVGCGTDSTVSDCHASGSVTGEYLVGGLVGRCYTTSIERCYAANMVVATECQAGGLVGVADLDSVISQCHACTSASARWAAGGLVGLNGSTIRTSWAEGEVSGGSSIGGLVGTNWKWRLSAAGDADSNGVITDCYATTDVICTEQQGGGLVGSNRGGTILRCLATGEVMGPREMGGLVGTEDVHYPAEVAQSFWDVEATGLSLSASGTGLGTPQMWSRMTFVEAGWDFADETDNGTDDIWWMVDGQDYPRLWWEQVDE